MHQNQRRVPFLIKPPSGDEFSMTTIVEEEIQGLLGLEEDEVVMQLRTTTTETRLDGFSVNVDTSDVDERRFPLQALASVDARGWWGRTIILTANDMTLFDGITGARGERLVLKVRHGDRARADDLVTALSFALSDEGHAHLDAQLRRLEDPAPRPELGARDPDRPEEV